MAGEPTRVLVQGTSIIGIVTSLQFSGGGRAPGKQQNYLGGGSDYVPGPRIPRRVHLTVALQAHLELNAGPHVVVDIPDLSNPSVHAVVCRFWIESSTGSPAGASMTGPVVEG